MRQKVTRLTFTLLAEVNSTGWVFKMAVLTNGLYKHLFERNCSRLTCFLKPQPVVVTNARNNFMFKHLQKGKEHSENYKYEISKDPKEWEFVERLMPLETVPVPKVKSSYPSGWKPPSDEALKHPYFVERTKNHMLSVHLKLSDRGQKKTTLIKNISGDLWKLHNELKAHLEEQTNRRVGSCVHEGNNIIKFRGDLVYYVEQWLLKKGF